MTTAAKPAALAVVPEAIPADLKAIDQYVVCQYVEEVDPETGEISYDKPPVNPHTGNHASNTNPKRGPRSPRRWRSTASTEWMASALSCPGLGRAIRTTGSLPSTW